MSTGRRLAKRSIIGTRVCAPGPDGLWYSGVIQDVKSSPTSTVTSVAEVNTEEACEENKYIVRFDFKTQDSSNTVLESRRSINVDISPAQALRRNAMIKEFFGADLIGPGFRSMVGVKLQPGQRVYLTYNGRETSGDIVFHDLERDEVIVKITVIGNEEPIELRKRLEEVRLLESRRSARLADQDRNTDFARLADMGGDRRKTQSIEVPLSTTPQQNSRKRPPSYTLECNGDMYDDEEMNENNAAMILVTLSLSPKSPRNAVQWLGSSPGSSSASWSSGSSSPPLSDDGHNMGANNNQDSASARNRTTSVSTSDEGIVVDYKDCVPRKKRASRSTFVCTWKGCKMSEGTKIKIERHIRFTHLGGKKLRLGADRWNSDSQDSDSHEEEFYYTEVEDNDDDCCKTPSPTSPPTLSHRDMARPPHEDPEYQKNFVGNIKQGRAAAQLIQQNGNQYNSSMKHKQHNGNIYQHTVYVSNNNQQQQHLQQLQSNSTSCIPTSPLAHHNYTWPVASATTVITTSVSNTSNLNSNINSNNAAVTSNHYINQYNHQQQQTTGTTYIKHARASPRPSQLTAPYPSPTYVHQHHNYSSPAPISPNNSTAGITVTSASAKAAAVVNNHTHNSSSNSVLQQLSQQNVTVTTHHCDSQHITQQQQQLQQLQQQQLATVTITPNFSNTQGIANNDVQHRSRHHQQQQQQQQQIHSQQQVQQKQQRLQQSPTATASHRLVASNAATSNCNNNNSAVVPPTSPMPPTANTGHINQHHVAVQHVNKQTPNSPNRRTRGENKKCRKVYGMDRRDMWCTQCRWKKACSRFGD